jgi:drug/metabolite transporter (DMT)-like permease
MSGGTGIDNTPARQIRRATVALLLATVLWGCGFTWAKAAGDAVHRTLGLPTGSAFGPVFVLGWRFSIAAVILFMIMRRARGGWTSAAALRVFGVGLLLYLGLVLQHLGLDLTPEAVSAFLTSLTILFVPMILTVALRKPPPAVMWVGVVLATAGVWLLVTGGERAGFTVGWGEALGLACAVAFSLYILAVNAAARSVDAWQLTAGQFLVVGVACFITCTLVQGHEAMRPARALGLVLSGRDVWLNILLLMLFPTVGAFTLLNLYQPKLDPTRAALIYLVEPVIAAAYAWLTVGRKLPPEKLLGAALILVANAVVEVLAARGKAAQPPPSHAGEPQAPMVEG